MSDTALSTWCNMDHAYLTRNSLAITNHCFEPIRPADTNFGGRLEFEPTLPHQGYALNIENILAVALYLALKAAMILHIINSGMIDRRCHGPQRPGDSQGRHALQPVEPEQ